ncbi:hypothetical protein V5740_08535 [Croceibacterium sp. TMG7-5b_MA50]|uniref:hypothetical protein n=1 Tax=Croceibacterium sp. TMG7-5b_MA50 TaxID=3121290 RepID=UPI0032217307
MATLAPSALRRPAWATDTYFFLVMAVAMAAFNVAGFSLFAAMGISSFGAPLWVHVHALLFFGWVVLFVTQAWLAASGRVALHRPLGWLALGWVAAMIVVGTLTTMWSVQRGFVPFFFTPAQFLLLNPLSVVVFAGLVIAGFVHRRDRLWHPRLIVCGMAAIMGPSIGRMLPMPLLIAGVPIPYFATAIVAGTLVFPLVGAGRDLLKRGGIHPAWLVGMAAIAGMELVNMALAQSAPVAAVYEWAVAGTPGAMLDPHAYGPPPPPP